MAHIVDDDNRVFMIGTVTKINPEKAKARVLFEDKDEITSKEIPIMFNRTKDMKIYAMPEIGEQVICSFLANGIEEGFVLGAYYDEIDKPPVKDPAIKIIKFKTDDYIMYNDNTQEMEIKCKTLRVKGDFHVTGHANIDTDTTSPTFIGDLNGLADGVK